MLRATDMAQLLLRQRLNKGDVVVDATVGNGHDTVFLADQVGPSGQVIGFDVQQVALDQAAVLLGARSNVRLVHAGHERLAEHLVDDDVRLAAVIFNLGYLPGADKSITTDTATTLAALQQALARLAIGGVVTLVVYPGHPGGAEEAHAVQAFVESLENDFSVSRYHRVNAVKPAPELIVVERKR